MSIQKKRYDAVAFGELLLRLTSPDRERIAFGESFVKHAGGAELNVMAGLAMLGMKSAVLSKMPDNEITHFIRRQMKSYGVDDSNIVFDKSAEARVGVYYYEQGISPRKPSVIYDRNGSSINRATMEEFDSSVFSDTRLFHLSGISLALGEQCRKTAIDLIKAFHQHGTAISFDVNYRANLWSEEEARKTIEEILPMVDILFISEETSRRMFQKEGALKEIMKSFCNDYPIKMVVSTERKVITPAKHSFASTVYALQEDGTEVFYTEPGYQEIEVLDRIGSGDAFVAGALFGWMQYLDYQKMIAFGNAMAAVQNTVFGDLPKTSFEELCRLIEAQHTKGIQSEMNR